MIIPTKVGKDFAEKIKKEIEEEEKFKNSNKELENA